MKKILIDLAGGAGVVAGALLLLTGGALADDAPAIVKRMADWVASQTTIAATFDTEIEVVTPFVQKLQFTSSGTIDIARPDKFHATRTGGYADVVLNADGKTLTLLGKNLNAYAEAPIGGSIDEVVAKLRDELGADLPAADLLIAHSYEALMEGVIEAKHIGRGVIGGVECDHLAFRTIDTDWQLWVEVGDKPVPRKYLITSKAVGAAPQYAITFTSWTSGAQLPADTFTFKAPSGARKVDLGALGHIDEVPPAGMEQPQ